MAVYYRTNLTTRQLAPLFGVSPATVCRVVQRLGPLLALEPARTSREAVERLWIVDGTIIPVRDRVDGLSMIATVSDGAPAHAGITAAGNRPRRAGCARVPLGSGAWTRRN